MITIRSLLWEAVIALWIDLNLHRLASARLIFVRRRASALLSLRVRTVGRILKPLFRALLIEPSARLSDPPWQTTRVLPVLDFLSAEARERAFGTFPPAHGLIVQSGDGVGQ